MNSKKWTIKSISKKEIPMKNLFENRNKYNMSEEEFFHPSIDDEYDGMLMLGMKKSVDKIFENIDKNQKICIYGDYDVDGTSATAILLKTFALIDYNNVIFYLPHRKEEGYGLNKNAITNLAKEEVKLIITVDCGITAVEEVDVANELGIDIIITDHHQIGDIIPKSFAIINPHQKGCKYPYKNLCGAGVAYKLAKELLKVKNKKISNEILEIAGVATVADIMEINGENRIIVKNAINSIQQNCENLGIKALLNEAGIEPKDINTYAIGFGIAPRINSAGRIDDARLSVRLYMAKNEIEAKTYANKLNFLNYQRQEMVKNIYESSLEQGKKQDGNAIVVTYDNDWDIGVIGIVASRLVDSFGKPSVVMGINEDGIASASCRSLGSFNIFEALNSINHMFEKFGGHDMAAGFSLKVEKINEFIEKINEYARNVDENEYKVSLEIDALLDESSITLENYDKIQKFEPFGISNKRPTFMLSDVVLEYPQFMGKDGTHFRARTIDNKINMIKFNCFEEYKDVDFTKPMDIVFSMNKNVYNDMTSVQMMIEDIRYSYNYEKEYEQIYSLIRDNISYFESDYGFRYADINFKKIKIYDITKLDGKNLFLCYSYHSYFYIRKIFEYEGKQLDIYQDDKNDYCDNVAMIFPLLEKSVISDFDNVILCDDIKHIEQILFEYNQCRYFVDFSEFDVGFNSYDIRKNMVILYNFYSRYSAKNMNIHDILSVLKIDVFIFFISNLILKKTNLIDINYDFKYNKICTKIKATREKQNLNENIIYKKFEEYFSSFNIGGYDHES